jgi:hypothetical protein
MKALSSGGEPVRGDACPSIAERPVFSKTLRCRLFFPKSRPFSGVGIQTIISPIDLWIRLDQARRIINK